MSFTPKHVLLVGATSGIGRALADSFVSQGIKVTAVGRRQDRIDQFVKQHGSEIASGIAFDIADTKAIPQFVSSAFDAYPSIDSVFLNAGTQTSMDFAKPAAGDLETFHQEININFSSFVTFTHALLPKFLTHEKPTSLVFTGSPIGIVPAYHLPAYASSKAALEAFVLCLREQLRETSVKVSYISPGPVQSEFHPNYGMPVDKFVDATLEGLAQGKENIYPGVVGGSTLDQFMELVKNRDGAFVRLTRLIRGMRSE